MKQHNSRQEQAKTQGKVIENSKKMKNTIIVVGRVRLQTKQQK